MLQANTHQHGLDAEHDPPIVVALMPSTARQRAMAAGVAVIILALAAIVAPFVNVQSAEECRDMRELRDKVARHYGRQVVQFSLSLPNPEAPPPDVPPAPTIRRRV